MRKFSLLILALGFFFSFSSFANNQRTRIPDYAWREPVPYTLESAHPYGNSVDQTWTIQQTGAKYLRINFLNISIEPTYDHLYITDETGRQVAHYSQRDLTNVTVEVAGSTANIRLTSDSSVTEYGFKIFSYQVSNWPH